MAIRKLTEHTLDLGDVMTLLGIKYKYVKDVKMDYEVKHEVAGISRRQTLVVTVVNK